MFMSKSLGCIRADQLTLTQTTSQTQTLGLQLFVWFGYGRNSPVPSAVHSGLRLATAES